MATKKLGFEDSLKRLESIVSALEKGSASLEDSLVLFEEGTALLKNCNKLLDEAEQKVKLLSHDADGDPIEENFDGEN